MKTIRTDFDPNYTNQDWAEVKMANETLKHFKKEKKMNFLSKDEDGKWMLWENKPQLVIPINERNPMYYEAKGDFKTITEAEALEMIQKIPLLVEI